MDNIYYITYLSVILASIFIILYLYEFISKRKMRSILKTKISNLEEQLQPVVDAEKEADRILSEANSEIVKFNKIAKDISDDIDALKVAYHEKKNVYDNLLHKIAIFDECLSFAEMGIYEPHFDFTDSEVYKKKIEEVRAEQKRMVTLKTAVICTTAWTVDGSKAKGQTMTGRNIRLTLRAFNNECDAAIANIRWNNANAMIKRIGYARDQINKLNETNAVIITFEYYDLKLKELQLTHEYREKLKEEKEERAEAARTAREEQRLIKEMEEAEREEFKYQQMLEKAKSEITKAEGDKLARLSQRISELEQNLSDAHAKFERAQSMAEMTRSGYVYIISNIGSFGPDMIKIGLTRRLDPTDRIRELGDASVPFFFDTHAIIYSDDAPLLEKALHNEFSEQRVNATNMRKEFFRVSIDQVESALSKIAPGASFFKDVEAQEYRETLALRKAMLDAKAETKSDHFPESL